MATDAHATSYDGATFSAPLSRPFWEALRSGRFVLQRCESCERRQHYPRVMCRYCGSRELRWTSASTSGTVVAAVLTHRTSRDALRPLLPYPIAVVRMDDGPLVLGTAALGVEAPRAGGRVEIDSAATSSSGVLTFGEARDT